MFMQAGQGSHLHIRDISQTCHLTSGAVKEKLALFLRYLCHRQVSHHKQHLFVTHLPQMYQPTSFYYSFSDVANKTGTLDIVCVVVIYRASYV